MATYNIHLTGIVQGVGFRPVVYQLAQDMGLHGYVQNGSDGLRIFFNALEEDGLIFFKKIMQYTPQRATINSASLNQVSDQVFDGFSIVVAEPQNTVKEVLMSPDISLCEACRKELTDTGNRRYHYPFITCTQCGPRYSIVNELPYERAGTSMQPFAMCKSCANEYDNMIDRRFFSQTNSCADCGVQLLILAGEVDTAPMNTDEILSAVQLQLRQGKIVAVKGIGGYLLLCNANNPQTILLLRKHKHRKAKPFALLYPGTKIVDGDFEINEREKELLQGVASPIVLISPKEKQSTSLAIREIAPGLNRLGVMLPCSPLLQLIANDFGKPLVATSANISGSPIFYRDEAIADHLSGIADMIITYNRDIVIPGDDSVVQVSHDDGSVTFLRRSRGYAPSLPEYRSLSREVVLATGAFLKSSFTLSVKGNVFVSQFLGSGETYEAQQMYRQTLDHWLKLYGVEPAVILTDKHPQYFSHELAMELAEIHGAELHVIQHHHAHFAAVLAENGLMDVTESLLGVIWDGTGLGDDGNIWGGEFFKYENKRMQRCYHFDYFPVITVDKQAMEPRISALCACSETWPQPAHLKSKFTEAEWNTYHALINTTRLFTSSAGRLFDAVASLLDICDRQSYEGEAAMRLQVLAEEYVKENDFVMDASYFQEGAHYYRIPTASLMQGIIIDLQKGRSKKYIAAKFHYSLVCLVGIVAINVQTGAICFSGGVFQNILLTDWIKKMYSGKYKLFFHKNLSPNDENISFGQLVFHEHGITVTGENKTVKKDHAVADF